MDSNGLKLGSKGLKMIIKIGVKMESNGLIWAQNELKWTQTGSNGRKIGSTWPQIDSNGFKLGAQGLKITSKWRQNGVKCAPIGLK